MSRRWFENCEHFRSAWSQWRPSFYLCIKLHKFKLACISVKWVTMNYFGTRAHRVLCHCKIVAWCVHAYLKSNEESFVKQPKSDGRLVILFTDMFRSVRDLLNKSNLRKESKKKTKTVKMSSKHTHSPQHFRIYLWRLIFMRTCKL